MTDYLDPAEWSDMLAGFSSRNRFRRARFMDGALSVLRLESKVDGAS
jgi:hypothetical protein